MSTEKMMKKPPNHVEPPPPVSTQVASTRPAIKRVSKLGKHSDDVLKWTLKASRLKRQAAKAKRDRKPPAKTVRRPRA